jgi:hypothetical protein
MAGEKNDTLGRGGRKKHQSAEIFYGTASFTRFAEYGKMTRNMHSIQMEK